MSFSNVKDSGRKHLNPDENVNANKVSRYGPYHSFHEKKWSRYQESFARLVYNYISLEVIRQN